MAQQSHAWAHIQKKKKKKRVTEKDTYIPIFIAALFTIPRTWKQPKCPSTEE